MRLDKPIVFVTAKATCPGYSDIVVSRVLQDHETRYTAAPEVLEEALAEIRRAGWPDFAWKVRLQWDRTGG